MPVFCVAGRLASGADLVGLPMSFLLRFMLASCCTQLRLLLACSLCFGAHKRV